MEAKPPHLFSVTDGKASLTALGGGKPLTEAEPGSFGPQEPTTSLWPDMASQ